MKEKILEKFYDLYGKEGEADVYFAPGRVNLIGEHTDYNGGHVFPCALTIGTFMAVRKRTDRVLNFYSMNFSEVGMIVSSLDDLVCTDEAGWTNYPKGVIWAFAEKGMEISEGLDICVYGNIPAGSGLSSSASFEVVTGFMLRDQFGFEVTNTEIALIGQFAENKYVGMNCGIMDQFASAMGKKDNAIFLDTATLKYEYAPVKLENARIIITNSNVKHQLVGSGYNDRRRESEAALADLQKVCGIESLGELTNEELEKFITSIREEESRMRARHAVSENIRTIDAMNALKANDIETFGKLMNASHVSLRDDYEVSCDEIDILAEEAWKIDGVLGSRITGGGFGGCTVSIVRNDAVESFKEKIGAAYRERTGLDCDFYVVDIGDGPCKL